MGRKKHLIVRMTDDELELINMAKAKGQSTSDYVRSLIIAAAQSDKAEASAFEKFTSQISQFDVSKILQKLDAHSESLAALESRLSAGGLQNPQSGGSDIAEAAVEKLQKQTAIFQERMKVYFKETIEPLLRDRIHAELVATRGDVAFMKSKLCKP